MFSGNTAIRIAFFIWCFLPGPGHWFVFAGQAIETQPLHIDKSACLAFVGSDYIFTIELVKPGVPLLNFVSMTDKSTHLSAKNVQLTLDNRTAAGRLFSVETGQSKESVLLASMTIHPRSSFGIRLEGSFGTARELYGAAIQLDTEVLLLAPLTCPDFEQLAAKINRINLDSPDFRQDRKALRLELMGERSPSRR